MKSRITLMVTLIALLLPPITIADTGGIGVWFTPKRLKEVDRVSNARYAEECSACHFAYQPGLLPARSWEKLLDSKALADHFGENAELGEEVRLELEKYAVANAADESNYKRSRKIMASIPNKATPLRITEIPYIKEKHSEIPKELIAGNPQVKSLSNCNHCHTRADKGVFDDDTVFIKGHGPWDD
jgi:mono/diheme cytochrome c family protein